MGHKQGEPKELYDHSENAGQFKDKPILVYVLILMLILFAVVVTLAVIRGRNADVPDDLADEHVSSAAIEENTDASDDLAAERVGSTFLMPTEVLISHPWQYYGSSRHYEYTTDGLPLVCEEEVEGCLYHAEFTYEDGRVSQSSLTVGESLECVGIYSYNEAGNVASISYTHYGYDGEETGDLGFYYGIDGDTYFVDIVPDVHWEFPTVPESFFEIPGIGSIRFEHDEVRLEFQLNEDGTIRQLYIRNMDDRAYMEGQYVQYGANGIATVTGCDSRAESENYWMEYDENGVPTTYNGSPVERFSSLYLEGIDFEESELDQLIRIPGPEAKLDYFAYEEYKTDAQHSATTQIRYSESGECMEQDDYQWASFTYSSVYTPFPFFYNVW